MGLVGSREPIESIRRKHWGNELKTLEGQINRIKDDRQLRLFHEWGPLSLKRLILQFTQHSPSKGKAHVVAAAIRKTVNETIGEFEKSKSIVK